MLVEKDKSDADGSEYITHTWSNKLAEKKWRKKDEKIIRISGITSFYWSLEYHFQICLLEISC